MTEDKETIVMGKCIVTGKAYSVTVKTTDMRKYETGQHLIQNVFPYLSSGDREFIKTRISPEGWEQMFKEEEN